MKKIWLSLVLICLLLAGCTQSVYLPIGGGSDDVEASDYFIDDDGKVWKISYSEATGAFVRTWTGWYYATPETAQDMLDSAKSGENIYFGPGTYSDTYKIRTSRATSEVHEWVVEGTNSVIGDEITLDDLKADSMYQYVRYLSDMEFRADKEAVFTGNFIINNEFGPEEYDAVRQITVAPGKGYGNHIRIDGLVFNGFRFEGSCDNPAIGTTYGKPFINAVYNYRDSEDLDSIKGLEFRNCSFKGVSTLEADSQRAIVLDANRDGAYKDISFIDCTFDTLFQGVYGYHFDGFTAEGCTFLNLGHNAIALQNYQSGTPVYYNTGKIIVKNNAFTDISNAAVGRGGFQNADIEIIGNTFNSSGNEAGKVINLGAGGTYQKLVNVSITCSGNYKDGVLMEDAALSGVTQDNFAL